MTGNDVLALVQAYTILRDLKRGPAGGLDEDYALRFAQIEGLILGYIEAAFTVPDPGMPDAPVREQRSAALRALFPDPTNVPDEPDQQDDVGYNEFRDLLRENDVPITTGLARWFRDVGGWDKSTPDQRAEIYEAMVDYYRRKSSAPTQRDKDDIARCYACGSVGRERQSRSGAVFYTCSNPNCGFTGRDGDFRASTWDADNYEEKKRKFRAGGGARGARR